MDGGGAADESADGAAGCVSDMGCTGGMELQGKQITGKGLHMAVQKTYIMIKPDGVRKGHIGEIINRFERAGLTIERMELGMVTDAQARANYAEHEGKPFYEGLVSYVTSGPVVKMVISGEGAVMKCRSLMGATNPAEAAPGTIRGDFGLIMDENVIHGSDSPESAEREMGIFFG